MTARVVRDLLLACFLCLLCATAWGGYQTGLDAYNAGDYATALAEWKAEVGQPGEPANLAVYRETLYAIGMLYWRGEGVAQDYAVSAVWLKQAADINHPGAQVKLGYLHVTGQGVPRNYEEARRWFGLAAFQGDRDAAHNLDVMDEQGLGLPAGASDAAALVPGAVPESYAGMPSEPLAPVPPAAASGPSANPAPTASGGDEGAGWILARNPEHYTIQVVALREPGKLHEFIDRFPEWAPFAIYRPKGNERPLWVLVQGDYAEVEAARAAAASFPTGMQKRDKLWIRKFGMVQRMVE